MRWKSLENSIMREIKSGVVTIKQTVIRISSVTRKHRTSTINIIVYMVHALQ